MPRSESNAVTGSNAGSNAGWMRAEAIAPVPAAIASVAAATAHEGRHGGTQSAASALRREILLVIRKLGPASPDQLAGHLGVSRTGILQQLRALETAGFVSRRTERHGVGRPRHLYDVTPDAQGLFPSNYDGLAAGLLEAIEAVGGDDLRERIFEERRTQVRERVSRRLADRLPPDAPLVDRVRELAAVQDEQGYLCDMELGPDGTIRLIEHNCAIFKVASATATACRAELELFSDVLGADVVRETHITAGDRCCTYRIVPRISELHLAAPRGAASPPAR